MSPGQIYEEAGDTVLGEVDGPFDACEPLARGPGGYSSIEGRRGTPVLRNLLSPW